MSASPETSAAAGAGPLGRLGAAAAVAVLAGTLHAQARAPRDDGPVIIGENRGKYVWWDLQRFSTELSFYGEFHNDKQSVQGQPDNTLRDDRIRTSTTLSFESYI